MSTITKEQLQQIEAAAKEALWPVVWSGKKARKLFNEKITPEVVLELARIALASLEAEKIAEPVAKVETVGVCWYADNGVPRKPAVGTELYAAPPAPETADREMLKRLAVILSGSDAPGEIRSLTVTAQSFVERCKALAKERDACHAVMLKSEVNGSPSLMAMMRALDAFYADDDVPERAMLTAFKILLADVNSQAAPQQEAK